MISDVRYADEVADHRNNGKEQRDEKTTCVGAFKVGMLVPCYAFASRL
jgi:hypothetical protein